MTIVKTESKSNTLLLNISKEFYPSLLIPQARARIHAYALALFLIKAFLILKTLLIDCGEVSEVVIRATLSHML